MSICTFCQGNGFIEDAPVFYGPFACSGSRYSCDECDGTGQADEPADDDDQEQLSY
jgi:hypothetical protein